MEVTLKYGHGTHGTLGPVFRGRLGMYVTAPDGQRSCWLAVRDPVHIH